MKPTTIYLPEETENQLQEMANNTGKSIAELIQELIISQFPQSSKKLPKSVGMGASISHKLRRKSSCQGRLEEKTVTLFLPFRKRCND
jgi:hypothetical protein